MQETDKGKFVDVMTMMATVYGVTLSDDQIRAWWALLSPADIDDFESAAMEYMRTDNAFMPKPGQMLALIAESDGRPTPEEAWNMVNFDEAATNVWTPEMATAFFAALESGSAGDRVAARVAFLEVYKREVKKARADGIAVTWAVSFGHDVNGRETAILDAVERGRLTVSGAQTFLPHLTENEITRGKVLPPMTRAKLLPPADDAA